MTHLTHSFAGVATAVALVTQLLVGALAAPFCETQCQSPATAATLVADCCCVIDCGQVSVSPGDAEATLTVESLALSHAPPFVSAAQVRLPSGPLASAARHTSDAPNPPYFLLNQSYRL